MKNVIRTLAKIVLLPLRLTEAASAPGIHKKILGSEAPTLIISNDETEEIMKIDKPLEDFGLWIRCKVLTKYVTR